MIKGYHTTTRLRLSRSAASEVGRYESICSDGREYSIVAAPAFCRVPQRDSAPAGAAPKTGNRANSILARLPLSMITLRVVLGSDIRYDYGLELPASEVGFPEAAALEQEATHHKGTPGMIAHPGAPTTR